MVSQTRLPEAARYALRFLYPLDAHELWHWQIKTRYPLFRIPYPHYSSKLLLLKKQRYVYSQPKWKIAKEVGECLQKLPTIQAVFVTGALAMNNCPPDDDIDIFIVTSPHTLWLTRFLVVILLTQKRLRRPPHLHEHSSPAVSNKICDNLYLDADHLQITPHNLYLAHELLQAKPLFDKTGIQYQLLIENRWAKTFLPIAYRETLKKLNKTNSGIITAGIPVSLLNILFFMFQYLYMLPFKTTENISLGAAFFHPNNNIIAGNSETI